MATPAQNLQTAPVFSPDGRLGDIPAANLPAALKAGFKPGVTMKTSEGKPGVVPADRVQDAVKSGLTIVPFHEQETQHPGFWHSLYSDVVGMLPQNPNAGSGPDMSGRVGAATKLNEQQKVQQAADDAARKATGYSAAYRAIAPIAEAAGVNVKGMEESAAQGDVAGVAGHAAAVPTVMAATAGVAKGAPAVSDAAKAGLQSVGKTALAVGDSLDPDIVGLISPRLAHTLRLAQKVGTVATKLGETRGTNPGAPLPATPAPEMLQARGLATGATVAPPEPSAGLGTIPVRPPETPAAAATPATPPAQPATPTPAGEGLPRTLSGDSALRKVLTGQDNANLLKIAKSRGINVTKETQLKPGVADNMLINKIVDDFSPEELDEIRDRHLEVTRFRHDFGDIGPEAWKTLGLQTYFPDLKLPQTTIARTHAAILKAAAARFEKAATPAPAAAPAPAEDLTPILRESVKRVKARTLGDLQ